MLVELSIHEVMFFGANHEILVCNKIYLFIYLFIHIFQPNQAYVSILDSDSFQCCSNEIIGLPGALYNNN